jgi:ribosome-associated heat shock protein Hsp15
MSERDPSLDEGLRLDKWLWQARFVKSRGVAAKWIEGRKVRINRTLITKTHYRVRPGDVLTFPQGPRIRVVRILAIGGRRGPASEAQTLYEELGEA